jgi:hypothetical protein
MHILVKRIQLDNTEYGVASCPRIQPDVTLADFQRRFAMQMKLYEI